MITPILSDSSMLGMHNVDVFLVSVLEEPKISTSTGTVHKF